MNPAPIDQSVTIPTLRRLAAKGLLAPEEENRLEGDVRSQLPWTAWTDRGLLATGAALMLSGIVYFFAHNWDHLSNADKLALSAATIAVAFLGAAWKGFDSPVGKMLLLAACALVGVFIAVFGQVYQTGADNFQLFTAWAFLILPWVALARSIPIWLLWLAILNLAVGFYLPVSSAWQDDDINLIRSETVGLALLNGVALLIRETISNRGVSWLDRGWAVLILLIATVVPACLAVIIEILRTWDRGSSLASAFTATLIFTLLVVGLGCFYSRIRWSLAALAVITLGTCGVLTVQAARLLNLTGSNTGALTYLAQGLATLMIFGVGILFLRSQRHTN